MAIATGVRISELCGIDKKDIDLTEQKIHIRNGKGNKERYVFFTKEAMTVLQWYWSTRDDDHPAAFVSERRKSDGAVTRISKCSLSRQIHKLGIKADLAEKLHMHKFRKTFATWLNLRGADIYMISKTLGHKDISTTLRYAAMPEVQRHNTYTRCMENYKSA
jgi:integrase/recombinase XerD